MARKTISRSAKALEPELLRAIISNIRTGLRCDRSDAQIISRARQLFGDELRELYKLVLTASRQPAPGE